MLFPSAIMWLVFGSVSAFLARKRGKNPYLWFFLGTVFGVFGVLFLFFAPQPPGAAKAAPNRDTTPTIDITPKVSDSDKEKFWYYLDPDEIQQGPMSYEGLLRNYREGIISKNTHVWNENYDAWKRLSDLLE